LNHDQISSAGLFVIGLAICLGSIPYKLGSFSTPESGFMPFLIGMAITVFSAVGFIHSTMRKKNGEEWSSLMRGVRWQNSLIILASLWGYVFLLMPLGFFLCTTLFMAFLFRAIVPHRWPLVIGGALLTSTAAYVLFEVWLKAQLPKGLWGI